MLSSIGLAAENTREVNNINTLDTSTRYFDYQPRYSLGLLPDIIILDRIMNMPTSYIDNQSVYHRNIRCIERFQSNKAQVLLRNKYSLIDIVYFSIKSLKLYRKSESELSNILVLIVNTICNL